MRSLSILWRSLASILALGSLIFTLPASFWFSVILLMLVLPDEIQRHPPDWIDLLGWLPMIAVVAATGWVIYRIWRPYLRDGLD